MINHIYLSKCSMMKCMNVLLTEVSSVELSVAALLGCFLFILHVQCTSFIACDGI